MRHLSKAQESRTAMGSRAVLRRGATVMLAAATACLALATTALAQADSVVGSGEVEFQPFTVDAHSGPAGQSPAGSVFFELSVGALSGSVTCLFVQNGNEAVVGGELLPNELGASGYLLHVRDVTGGTDLVRLELLGFPAAGCDSFNLISPSQVTSGDIVVTDAGAPPPLPTSKEQCKKGGWRTFGIFKNQGDCVRFVASKSRNEVGKHQK